MEETSRRQERLSAVGRVAAGIAHEIRNPLAAMRGSIQVLRSELEADAPQRELMDIVLRESDRLNRIITDFLTYARPRKFSLAETDLREPLRETFALLRHSPELLDGHRLEEELPDGAAGGDGRRRGRPAGLLEPHAQRAEGDARRAARSARR